MKSALIYFIFYFSSLPLSAQLVDMMVHPNSISTSFFNAKFIKNKKIKSIKTKITEKPDSKLIIDEGLFKEYLFNEEGLLTQLTIIKGYGENTDTTADYFYYDDFQRLVGSRKRIGNIYHSVYYEYDALGNLKKEARCKETNASTKKDVFKLGKQVLKSLETFEYKKLNNNQYKKSCLNDEGRVYKSAIIVYDEAGRVKEENYEFTVSWVRIKNKYQYDAKGRLVKRTYMSNANGKFVENNVYEYDEQGNLLSEKNYENDMLSHEIAYLYNKRNALITSQVDRDFVNNSIQIVKYEYGFY